MGVTIANLLDALTIIVTFLEVSIYFDYVELKKGELNLKVALKETINKAEETHVVKGEGYR